MGIKAHPETRQLTVVLPAFSSIVSRGAHSQFSLYREVRSHAYYLLLITYYSLLTTHYLLLTTYYLP